MGRGLKKPLHRLTADDAGLERFTFFMEVAEPLYFFALTQLRTENRFALFLGLL
ncbi:hypothetical protein RLEG3_06235 (plasmid) [Rhizobium leguminosarum bv. trifolii WSM1689]|nr:hypothetical protein RLEG3_06235 [Rhizobium leguminosarum bv. trifolii WSM1689]